MEVLGPIIGAVIGVGTLGFLNKKIVERLVKWFTFLKGDLISVASILSGWGFAFLFPGIDPTDEINAAVGSPLTDLPYWAIRLITGVLIAIASGGFADHAEAKYGAIVVPGEGQVTGAERFDDGYNPGDPGYNPTTGTFDPAAQPPAH